MSRIGVKPVSMYPFLRLSLIHIFMVCELEGWDKLEYLDELLALVQKLRKGGGEDGNSNRVAGDN